MTASQVCGHSVGTISRGEVTVVRPTSPAVRGPVGWTSGAAVACEQVLGQKALVDAAAATSAHVDLAGTPHAAPLARIFLREQLRGCLDEETLRVAELLTTELVTNAVLHARTSVHVGVSWDAGNLLVTVQDDDPSGPRDRQGRLEPEGLETSGRGMMVVASLADDFGWTRLSDGVGKVMWFALATPVADSAHVPRQQDYAE